MSNVTLQIMAVTPPHVLNGDKQARRLTAGDIVEVWDADIVAPYDGANHRLREPIANPRFLFVHVRGVPRSVEQVHKRLTEPDSDDATEYLHRRRKWGVSVAAVPIAIRQRLQEDREITVSWPQVKAYVTKVREAVAIQDDDLDDAAIR